MKQVHYKLVAVFLISVALIAFELYVMRTFSIGSWSNFGALVISTALLGFGLAGTLLTFLRKRVESYANKWMTYAALFLIPAMALAHIAAQQVPFSPIFIGSDPRQILWIGLYYLIYSVPFFCSALFIGVAFIAFRSTVHRLYFWNLLGSGLGGVVIIAFLYLLPPSRILVPLLVLAFLAALFCMVRYDPHTGRHSFRRYQVIVTVLVLACSLAAVIVAGDIKVSQYKPISYVQKYPDAQLEHRSYGPTGEMHVYSSTYFHFAPGLSDNAALNLERMPRQPFWGLFIDGSGPIGIMGKLNPQESGYLDYLPMSAPYTVLDEPRVVIVRLAGGISSYTAVYHGAKEVTVVEPNPELIRLLGREPTIREFNGGLLDLPQIEVVAGEARHYCRTRAAQVDLVEVSLVDSIGLSETGGYALHEDFTYTVEAIADYMQCLNSDGFLSITVWNRLSPPRNVLKILSTVISSLREQEVDHPERRLFVFDLFLSTATILVKNGEMTATEIERLKDFCARRSFDIVYYPGIEPRPKKLEDILTKYREPFLQPDQQAGDDAAIDDIKPSDFYHLATLKLLRADERSLLEQYIFDIKPIADNRPYYSTYVRAKEIPLYARNLQKVSEEWGFLVLLGILIQSVVFALLIILLPLIGRRKELFSRKKGTLGVIVYFACLGLGYMFLEIYLIQRFEFFLTNPVFSVSLVISAMLIASGLGSLYGSTMVKSKQLAVAIAVAGIVACILFYVFGLSAVLDHFLGASLIVRCLFSIVVIVPIGFFLGVPFPSGLSTLSEARPGLLPWAWGMNGAFSVTGAVLSRVFSVFWGFPYVLYTAAAVYILAALLFGANKGQPARSITGGRAA